jgi:hypothetical protein
MPTADPLDTDQLLALLRDPRVESQEIAARAGVPREEAGRATRLLMVLPKAKPEEVATLPAPLAAALARAALAASRVDLLAALAGHAHKDVAKEAKRCLHLLRSRGVEVPEAPRPAPPAPAAQPAEPPPPAFASAPDGHGERAAWLPRTIPGRGIELGQAILSDERGLLALQVGLLGRKEWRAFARDIVARGAALGVTEVPRAQAHAWIAEARTVNERTGQRVPDGADLWLAQLGAAPAAPAPGAGLPPGTDEEERAAVASSAALHQLPLFRSWLAEEDFLRTVAARLDEVQVSPLYIDEQQRAAQLERVVADAAEEYLAPARRGRLAARLLAVADHLSAQGDPGNARAAAAVARALSAGQVAGSVPFARLLVEKAFSRRPAAPAGDAPAAATPASPLIVAPR